MSDRELQRLERLLELEPFDDAAARAYDDHHERRGVRPEVDHVTLVRLTSERVQARVHEEIEASYDVYVGLHTTLTAFAMKDAVRWLMEVVTQRSLMSVRWLVTPSGLDHAVPVLAHRVAADVLPIIERIFGYREWDSYPLRHMCEPRPQRCLGDLLQRASLECANHSTYRRLI